MFDEKNQDRGDALGERLQRIGGQMNPSPALLKAAKTGVPLRAMPLKAAGIKYTAGTHVRKFSKAVLVYAAGIALLLGSIFLLPQLFGEHGPVATNPEEMLSPGTVAEMVFSETNVTYTVEANSRKGNTTIQRMMRDGDNLYYYQSGVTEGYYDVAQSMGYAYDKQNDVWVKEKAEGITWEILCVNHFADEYFNDLDYAEMDGYYKITESGLARLIGDGVYDRTVCDFTLKNGVYTFQLIRNDEKGNVTSSIVIEISFGTASVTLPDAKQCEHRYIGGNCEVCGKACPHEYEITSTEVANPCTDDNSEIYTCKKCRYSYTKTIPAPGHDYENGVCTRCGEADPEAGECTHEYVSTENTPTCTEGAMVVQACTKCGYSYEEWQKLLGHEFVDGECSRCGSIDLTAIGGDKIMDLIKADGCPEDKLIYGFDTEADADELAKIREFIYTDAGNVFTIFSPTFYDPTQVSLYGILYESISKTPITEEERQEYYDLVGLSPEAQECVSPHKLTTAEIGEYLMTYLGIPFTEDMKAALLAPHYYKGEQVGSVTYMEKYDAYYMHNTDSSTNLPNELVKAYTNENGYIMVLVDPSRYYDHVTAIVLARSGDGYRFVMCVGL